MLHNLSVIIVSNEFKQHKKLEFAVNLPKLEIANLEIAATSSTNAMLLKTIEAIVKLQRLGRQESVMNFLGQEIVDLATDATSFTELRDSR